jgi:hypothetical protein
MRRVDSPTRMNPGTRDARRQCETRRREFDSPPSPPSRPRIIQSWAFILFGLTPTRISKLSIYRMAHKAAVPSGHADVRAFSAALAFASILTMPVVIPVSLAGLRGQALFQTVKTFSQEAILLFQFIRARRERGV